jgi:IS30 family transposase
MDIFAKLPPKSPKISCTLAHITEQQRYQISCLVQAGKSQTEIAQLIGKHKSVICRELKRNCDGRNHQYKPDLAQRKAEIRKKEKPHFKALTPEIEERLTYYLKQDYSPEQIVGVCRNKGIEMASIETIYVFIWDDKRKGGTLHLSLRRKGRKYQKRGSKNAGRGVIPNRIDIDQRPAIVDEKQRFGDLEIDLVIGKNHQGALLTIVDRVSSMVWISKLKGKDSDEVSKAVIAKLLPFKAEIHTITSDNGKEFADHQNIAKALECEYYFAKPYHSWERGANENMNGLIRQYFPKKSSFENITDEDIKRVQDKLNTRPRKKHKFSSPIEFLNYKFGLTKVAFAA